MNEELRAITKNQRSLESAVMMSRARTRVARTMPVAKSHGLILRHHIFFGFDPINTVSGAISRISALRIRRYIGSSSKGPNHRGLRHAFFGAVPVDEPFFDIGFMIYLRDF